MSKPFRAALCGLAAWSWVALVLCVNYALDPWTVGTVQCVVTAHGIGLLWFIALPMLFAFSDP